MISCIQQCLLARTNRSVQIVSVNAILTHLRKSACYMVLQAIPDNVAPAPAPTQPKQYLYEPRFGLPVVRRELSYTDLLKSVRQGKVKSVNWFKADHKGTAVVDGPCLVEFIDGTLFQSNVPMEEVRYSFQSQLVYSAPVLKPG